MNLKEERLQWCHDAEKINGLVNGIIDVLNTNDDTEPAAYMVIDMPYRQYLQWLHSAQVRREDPAKVRTSVVLLISMMIMEIATRISGKDENQNKMQTEKWVGELIEEIVRELYYDLQDLKQRQ